MEFSFVRYLGRLVSCTSAAAAVFYFIKEINLEHGYETRLESCVLYVPVIHFLQYSLIFRKIWNFLKFQAKNEDIIFKNN